MPEAPEVEKLKRQLDRAWTGRTFIVQSNLPNSPGQKGDHVNLVGSKVYSMERLGKFIRIHLSPGWYWTIHLSSTGWFLPANERAAGATQTDPIHTNFLHKLGPESVRTILTLDDGQTWEYRDPRTWGQWSRGQYAFVEDPYFADKGPDWLLDPPAAKQALRLTRSNRTIKEVLCDQHVTQGLGNYLACETLFQASIHPHTKTRDLSYQRRTLLTGVIPIFLALCLEKPDHSHWSVFKRKGEPCRSCATPIAYLKDGATGKRGSYFCPHCQSL